MSDIHPQYEVLYNDLKGHNIGNYLASRDFKLFMSSIKVFELWKEVFNKVKLDRTYVSLGFDHEPNDSENTLAILLNSIPKSPDLEDLIVNIIVNFIDSKRKQTNFDNVIESIHFAKFSKWNIQKIIESYEYHKTTLLPDDINYINKSKKMEKRSKKEVFIVHGHDNEAKIETARFIESLGLKPIILHEQVSSGKTIIEKIEEYSNVGFGIVLYTPCDLGSKKVEPDNLKSRARQNVVFEHGYLIGKIGRANVCALVKGDVETPNDISGVVYVSMDNNKGWQIQVAKEMKNSGYPIDLNKL